MYCVASRNTQYFIRLKSMSYVPLALPLRQQRAVGPNQCFRWHSAPAAAPPRCSSVTAKRVPYPSLAKAELLTDDFAPVNLYDAIGRQRKKQP
jgi:hypothetical protein